MKTDSYIENIKYVKFSNTNSGYENQMNMARLRLIKDYQYTVVRIEVDGWQTDYFLKEIPGIGFNSCLFNAA